MQESQGSPISPILYLFYNADLLEIPGNNGSSWGFIDDIAYGIQGESDEHNVKELQRMLMKAEEWRERHGVKFETSKYALTHFSRRRVPAKACITIGQATIEPANEANYLGVIFDRKLHLTQHVQHAARKGTKFALAISRIANSTWGVTYRQTKMLFTSVVTARIDYVWLSYGTGQSKKDTRSHQHRSQRLKQRREQQ